MSAPVYASCGVCKNNFAQVGSDTVRDKDGHLFHRSCILVSLRDKKRCPIDDKPLFPTDLVDHLFDKTQGALPSRMPYESNQYIISKLDNSVYGYKKLDGVARLGLMPQVAPAHSLPHPAPAAAASRAERAPERKETMLPPHTAMPRAANPVRVVPTAEFLETPIDKFRRWFKDDPSLFLQTMMENAHGDICRLNYDYKLKPLTIAPAVPPQSVPKMPTPPAQAKPQREREDLLHPESPSSKRSKGDGDTRSEYLQSLLAQHNEIYKINLDPGVSRHTSTPAAPAAKLPTPKVPTTQHAPLPVAKATPRLTPDAKDGKIPSSQFLALLARNQEAADSSSSDSEGYLQLSWKSLKPFNPHKS